MVTAQNCQGPGLDQSPEMRGKLGTELSDARQGSGWHEERRRDGKFSPRKGYPGLG